MGVKRPMSVHIERLVLEGVSPADRHAVAAAVERELARTLAERGLPPEMEGAAEHRIDRADGGAFTVSTTDPAGRVGGRVAEGIYRGLSKTRNDSMSPNREFR